MAVRDEIMTASEVAADLRCSKAHVYNMINGKVARSHAPTGDHHGTPTARSTQQPGGRGKAPTSKAIPMLRCEQRILLTPL